MLVPILLLAAALLSGGPAAAQAATALRVESISPEVAPTADPSLIFRDDFASGANLKGRYFEYDDAKGSFVWTDAEGVGGKPGAMRCTFARGQVSAGSLKLLFGRNPFRRGLRNQETFREVYWRVYVKHEAGWQGNPAKLARLTCLAGSDWSQGFIAHVWGGKDSTLCIDPASGITDSRKVTSGYNDFPHLRWLGLRNAETPLFSPQESGRWVCVESHVKLNTPGKRDGVFQLWIDGRLEASREDLDWQGTWSDYAIDAFFLENYWNQGAVKQESRFFDDLMVGTRPLGPLVVEPSPGFRRTGGPVAGWQAQVASDPEGREVVWSSHTLPGEEVTARVGTDFGLFTGQRRQLPAGGTYWIRLRERLPEGGWSAWTAWHCPFRTAGKAK